MGLTYLLLQESNRLCDFFFILFFNAYSRLVVFFKHIIRNQEQSAMASLSNCFCRALSIPTSVCGGRPSLYDASYEVDS